MPEILYGWTITRESDDRVRISHATEGWAVFENIRCHCCEEDDVVRVDGSERPQIVPVVVMDRVNAILLYDAI